MKRITLALVGLGILGGVLYLGSRVWAQPPRAPAPQPLQTRVAVVNFFHVMKNYKKVQNLEENIRRESQEFDKKMEPERKKMIDLRNELQTPAVTGPARDQKERELKKLQHEAQMVAEDFQKRIQVQGDNGMVTLYSEVEEAVGVFARANAIEMVLQYADAITPADKSNPANLRRKANGALMPLYMSPGMDISEHIVTMLNQRYEKMMGGGAPAPR